MAYTTTVGKLLLKHYSPAATHKFLDSKELDKKNIGAYFADLAENHADSYKRVVSDLTRLGFESATRLGSTVRLGDLLPPDFKEAKFKKLHEEIEEIKKKKLTKAKENDEIINLLNKFSDEVNKELVETGIKDNKTLAKVVKAGARGSPAQYRQTIFSPVAVNDNKGGILTDFIIDRSFAEGLTLPQYLAHTFGSRQASAATKLAVASAGYLGKQLSRSGMTMVVEMHDCGTHNGVVVKVDDKDYLGSFLAKPVDKYNYNNEVTSAMLASLKTKGVHDIIVRNPITCHAAKDGHPNAVCQLCAGRREKGLPDLGSFLGIVAGTTLAEPLSQGMLNSKHAGGSARSASSFGGFKYVNQLFNIPETFVHEAPVAEHDGEVSEVRAAPQGGNYVVVKHSKGHDEHYVHPDLKVFVQPGSVVEPGDSLSDGIPNPAKIVKYKGIGEGRVYFANQIKNTFENSQLGGINKRNFDTISKNLISHVKITNPKGLGNFLPDTVVNYHSLENSYQPRQDSKKVRVDAAKGMYLESPELHYSIGTKLSNGMINNLKKHGVDNVLVHDESPGFEPEMQRLLDVPAHEHDWMHALYSTNLERRLIKAVNTGQSSSITGPSPVPGLAYAVGFGKRAEEVDTEALSFE
jgi:DNA-directed RNA polymerase subunit beta'